MKACRVRIALLVAVFGVGGVLAAPPPVAAEPESRVDLENGLRVLLRPLAGVSEVALVVLYDVGEDHDPEGASGLAHLVEHCYVTAAAGSTPARTAEALQAAYPQRWNAQTGSRYTVFATVFAPGRLEPELREAAARMGDLRVEQADLDREKPRLLAELHNMYEAVAVLAAQNRAREMVRPSAAGSRKGGVPEQVAAIGLEQVQEHHARHYKPRNAWLVLVGGFEARTAEDLVLYHFSGIASGEPLPHPRRRPPPGLGSMETLQIEGGSPAALGSFSLAYATPAYGSPEAAAFLVLMGRLLRAQMLQGIQGPVQIRWAMLDDPHAVFAYAPLGPGEDVDARIGEALGYVREVLSSPLSPQDKRFARDTFAFFLATRDLVEASLAQNLYGTAFAMGRRRQLGIDGPALAQRLDAVTQADLEAALAAVFAPERSAAVAVLPAAGEDR